MKHRSYIALIAILLTATQPAMASEQSLPMRAASGLGAFIASQGNAALTEIRDEVRKDLLERLKPYLPKRGETVPEKPQTVRPPAP